MFIYRARAMSNSARARTSAMDKYIYIKIGVDNKLRTYRDAMDQGVRLQPLVISSGGTMHKNFYHYLKAMIPDQQARRSLCTDMSIALVRARAELLMARAL